MAVTGLIGWWLRHRPHRRQPLVFAGRTRSMPTPRSCKSTRGELCGRSALVLLARGRPARGHAAWSADPPEPRGAAGRLRAAASRRSRRLLRARCAGAACCCSSSSSSTCCISPPGLCIRRAVRCRAIAYGNVVVGFRVLVGDVFYLVAMVALALHLYHGVWSSGPDAGLEPSPRQSAPARALATALSLLVPVAVLAIVRSPWSLGMIE